MRSLPLCALVLLAAGGCASGSSLESSLLERVRRQTFAPLTTAQQAAIVAQHNQIRAQQGASNMQILTWNSSLAAAAQAWSAGCVWGHGPGSQPMPFGQNVAQNSDTSVSQAFTDAINAWNGESSGYNLASNTCNPTGTNTACGHYTQLVWATTTSVGCGITSCPGFGLSPAFIVCNYWPAGNIAPLGGSAPGPPYLAGTACTKCTSGVFFCNGGLCDPSCSTSGPTCQCAAACKRCSTQTSGCSCQCKPGTTGIDCSGTCANLNAYCNPPMGVPGWQPSLCTNPSYPYVPAQCPLMCGSCQAGTPTC